MNKEEKKRARWKTVTWRIIAASITMTISLIVTGSIEASTVITAFESGIKMLAYYYHERVWHR